MKKASSDLMSALECPVCRTGSPVLGQEESGPARLRCEHCNARFPVSHGYVDFCPEYQEKITPIQHLLQFPPMIAIYDAVWRPLGYFITSDRSFREDLRRITELMEPEKHRLVLDLACGPGNFTRSIAQYGTNTTVVGFDLARQMLERAVRLTPRHAYTNVEYLRGDALSLPFRSGSFDAVICCGALQLFTNYDLALAEISRVLKDGGEFVCQTIVGPKTTPLWLRLSDRVMKFGYFQLEDLKKRLNSLNLNIVMEESSGVSYIFRAAKTAPVRA